MTDDQYVHITRLLQELISYVKPKPKVHKGVSTQTDAEWLTSLCADPAYRHIADVRREHAKAAVWCKENKRVLTRKFFVNWLNRIDKPMQVTAQKPDLPPVMTKPVTPLPKGEPPPPDVKAVLSRLLGKDMSF